MDKRKMLDASNILSELADSFSSLPEQKEKAMEAALFIELANSYLVEYIKHTNDGLESYDALIATVKGELKISESKRSLFKLMRPINKP